MDRNSREGFRILFQASTLQGAGQLAVGFRFRAAAAPKSEIYIPEDYPPGN